MWITEPKSPDALNLLTRILYAHDAPSGASIGEARLCKAFADEAREIVVSSKQEREESPAAGRYSVESGRTITRDGVPFVGIAKLNASTREATDFAIASVAALELAELVRRGETSPEGLQRLAGLVADALEGRAAL